MSPKGYVHSLLPHGPIQRRIAFSEPKAAVAVGEFEAHVALPLFRQ